MLFPSARILISVCFWCGFFKPLLTLILSINILHSIYEACIYICFLFNIEMKLYNTSILSTKLPLPSACPFLSLWPDRESWYFKLLSAIICGATSMSGPWVLARKLSPHVGLTESAPTAPLLPVPLSSCHRPCRVQTLDTPEPKPLLLVSSYPSQVGTHSCRVPCPSDCSALHSLLSRQSLGSDAWTLLPGPWTSPWACVSWSPLRGQIQGPTAPARSRLRPHAHSDPSAWN